MSEVKKTMSLIEKVVANIKGGDEAKKLRVVKFFDKLRKSEEKEIKKLKANLSSVELQYEIDKEEMEGKIEDYQEKVVDAYEDVNADDISSNATMEAFAGNYWARVCTAEDNLDYYTKQLVNLEKGYTENVKDIKEQITKREARIEKIS